MKKLYTAVFALLFTLVSYSSLQAQQTIFNVPSSDILDKGKVYFELDATFRFDRTRSVGKFSSFVPRVVVGTGGDVEVGLNIFRHVAIKQSRSARFIGNSLRLYERRGEQRFGVCGNFGEHALV